MTQHEFRGLQIGESESRNFRARTSMNHSVIQDSAQGKGAQLRAN